MKSIIRKIQISIIVLLLFFSQHGEAQVGLGGFNAVLTVPTAQTLNDGYISVGFGFIPEPFALYEGPDHDNVAYFATFGFLPFAEISFRSTLSLDSNYPSIGDRMASLRIQFFSETSSRPALAIGAHDLSALLDRAEGANNWFHALYLVGTKATQVSKHIDLNVTAGYGVDWIKAGSHEFNGLFGGVNIGFSDLFFIKSEYDARRFNFGLGLSLLNFLDANFVMLDGETFAFGANLCKRL